MNERLKEIRLSTNMSQEAFGKKIGIESRAHISSLENGSRNITDRIVNDVCREFDVNEHWLRTGEGEMFERLTDQQRVMKYAAMLMKDKDSLIANAITSFIITYEQLDNTSKKVLEDIALKYLENMKKGQ